MQAILKVLSDGKPHAYGELERKADTNWNSVRDHCENLRLFDAVEFVDGKVKITSKGRDVLKKLND